LADVTTFYVIFNVSVHLRPVILPLD
jgi:hypothetical protein